MYSDEWYALNGAEDVDSPALLIYSERLNENIEILKSFTHNVTSLRPHVKTHKSGEVTKLLMDAGIQKFKCATIAEAEMLAIAGAPDVLLAYQPVGPKVHRLAELLKKYPNTTFSCLIDNYNSAKDMSSVFQSINRKENVFIDLNVGMNRTGISPDDALKLYVACKDLPGIQIIGLHAYDGHIRDIDLAVRTQKCDEAFSEVEKLKTSIEKQTGKKLLIVAGGTPTFPIHAKRKDVECSPGTFIYWDKGYQSILHEQPFLFAALVITRIISIPDHETICIDLGHKSIASENTLDKRVTFLNAPELQPIGHSEEHMVLRAPKNNNYKVGDILYGVPYHICPTVALYDRTNIVEDHRVTSQWYTLSRGRKISI